MRFKASGASLVVFARIALFFFFFFRFFFFFLPFFAWRISFSFLCFFFFLRFLHGVFLLQGLISFSFLRFLHACMRAAGVPRHAKLHAALLAALMARWKRKRPRTAGANSSQVTVDHPKRISLWKTSKAPERIVFRDGGSIWFIIYKYITQHPKIYFIRGWVYIAFFFLAQT